MRLTQGRAKAMRPTARATTGPSRRMLPAGLSFIAAIDATTRSSMTRPLETTWTPGVLRARPGFPKVLPVAR